MWRCQETNYICEQLLSFLNQLPALHPNLKSRRSNVARAQSSSSSVMEKKSWPWQIPECSAERGLVKWMQCEKPVSSQWGSTLHRGEPVCNFSRMQVNIVARDMNVTVDSLEIASEIFSRGLKVLVFFFNCFISPKNRGAYFLISLFQGPGTWFHFHNSPSLTAVPLVPQDGPAK